MDKHKKEQKYSQRGALVNASYQSLQNFHALSIFTPVYKVRVIDLNFSSTVYKNAAQCNIFMKKINTFWAEEHLVRQNEILIMS